MTTLEQISASFQDWANQPDRKTEQELRKRFDDLSREIERTKRVIQLEEKYRPRFEALQKARSEATRRVSEIGRKLAETKREHDQHSKALADLPVEQIGGWSKRNRELTDLLNALIDALRNAETVEERTRIELENYSRMIDPRKAALLSRLILLEEQLAASNNGADLSADDFRRITTEIAAIKQQIGGWQ